MATRQSELMKLKKELQELGILPEIKMNDDELIETFRVSKDCITCPHGCTVLCKEGCTTRCVESCVLGGK